MVHQLCNICLELDFCFSGLIECLIQVYLYFVIKRRQARRRIPWNSCACSIFHVFYILGIISEFLNSQPSCCQLAISIGVSI